MRKFFSKITIEIICNLIFFLSCNLAYSQVSMYGGDATHTNIYNSLIPENLLLEKKWSFRTNGQVFSSAAISENVIYFGSDDSCLYAVKTDGTLLWKFNSNGKIRSSAAIKDTVVYFINYKGIFYALDTRTGKEIWRFTTEGEKPHAELNLNGYEPAGNVYVDLWDFYESSPVFIDSIIYFGCGTNFYAIKMATGKQLWKYTTPNVIHSSPALKNGIVYFGCYDSKLYALDALTGIEKFTFQTGTDPTFHTMEGIQASPTIIDTIVYFGSRDANAYAINAKTGKRIWSFYTGGSWMPSSFAVLNDSIYTGSSDDFAFFAFNRFNGQKKYTINTNCYNFSTPAIANEIAFQGSVNGSLFAIDLRNKRVKSRFDTDGRKNNYLKAILKDGSKNPDVLYYPTREYVVSEGVMNKLRTAGCILSSPVIDKSIIYFGSTDSCFYAISDNGKPKPKISVNKNAIDMGDLTLVKDTAFYVYNSGEIEDSVNVYIGYPEAVKSGFEISPSSFKIASRDSVKVKVKINTEKLDRRNSTFGAIIITPKYNIYNFCTTKVMFAKANSINYLRSKVKKISIYPNPFINSVEISYSLSSTLPVYIDICNISGEKVAELINKKQSPGEYKLMWNGTNKNGTKLMSGIYLCNFNINNEVSCEKIVLIR